MPKWLIAVIACVITILIGVNGYLFYSYFSFKPKPVVTPTPFISQEVTISGEIKPGWQLPQGQNYCPRSYYLVSDPGITEVKPSNQMLLSLSKDFRLYTNTRMNGTGITQPADTSSCGNFIEVQTSETSGFNLQDFTVDGIIACVPDSESEGPSDCSKSLQIGDAYLGLIGDKINYDDFTVGDRVRVTGVTDNTFISLTRDFSGVIQVSSIQKI